MLYNLAALIVLIADIYAIVKIIQSGAEPLAKILWVILILIAPLIGFIIWYFLGPNSPAKSSSATTL